jgi:hypothetical protein
MGNSLFLQFIPKSLAGITLLGLQLASDLYAGAASEWVVGNLSGRFPATTTIMPTGAQFFPTLPTLFCLAHVLPIPSLVASSGN